MKNSFRIEFKKIDGNLHVDPKGDFDGSSAWELINLLHREYNGEGQVFVDTHGLRNIYPFGGATFKCHFHQILLPLERLIFKGERASEIAPKGSRVISSENGHSCSCDGKCTNCRCAGKVRTN